MRHPFDGVIGAPPEILARTGCETDGSATARPARRGVLRALAAFVAGAAGGFLAAPREASAQTVTTMALGEEGGPGHRGGWSAPRPPGHDGLPPPGHRAPRPVPRWGATTQALGEEGEPPRRRRSRRRVTTQALGEEGGRGRRGYGLATTEALGEEGADGGWPRF